MRIKISGRVNNIDHLHELVEKCLDYLTFESGSHYLISVNMYFTMCDKETGNKILFFKDDEEISKLTVPAGTGKIDINEKKKSKKSKPAKTIAFSKGE